MSVNSVGRLSPQAAPHPAKKPEGGSGKELATVTTHCSEKHEHTPSCPHTVSTRLDSKAEELGRYFDEWA